MYKSRCNLEELDFKNSSSLNLSDSDGRKFSSCADKAGEPQGEFAKIGTYLKKSKKYPLLSKEEESSLSKRVKEGDKIAREKFILSNLRLVANIARKYQNKGMSLEELIQEGNIGLIKAVDRFDADKGFRFSTYAVWWIRQSIVKALSHKTSVIRLPEPFYRNVKAIQTIVDEALIDRGTVPDEKEIASKTGLSIKAIRKASQWLSKPVSIDSAGDSLDGSNSKIELVDLDTPAPDEVAEQSLNRARLIELVSRLPDKERNVINLLYGLNDREPLTKEIIARQLRLPEKRIEHLEKRAVSKLKRFAACSKAG